MTAKEMVETSDTMKKEAKTVKSLIFGWTLIGVFALGRVLRGFNTLGRCEMCTDMLDAAVKNDAVTEEK